jgi:hypothetical protein
MKTTVLTREGIKAVVPFGANERTRYAFDGVQLSKTEDGRPVLVATDGKILGRATFPAPDLDTVRAFQIAGGEAWTDAGDGEEGNQLLPMVDLLRVANHVKGAANDGNILTATENSNVNRATFRYLHAPDAGGATETSAPIIKGSFPGFAPILDKVLTGPEIGLSVDTLDALVKACKGCGAWIVRIKIAGDKPEETCIHFRLAGDGMPDGLEVDGAIMPVSSEKARVS